MTDVRKFNYSSNFTFSYPSKHLFASGHVSVIYSHFRFSNKLRNCLQIYPVDDPVRNARLCKN